MVVVIGVKDRIGCVGGRGEIPIPKPLKVPHTNTHKWTDLRYLCAQTEHSRAVVSVAV
jgi:hypothetical protein